MTKIWLHFVSRGVLNRKWKLNWGLVYHWNVYFRQRQGLQNQLLVKKSGTVDFRTSFCTSGAKAGNGAAWKQGNKSKYSQICVISSKNQYFMKNIAKECHIYDKYLFCNKFTSLFINPPFSWFSPHKQLALYLICYENCFIFI